MRLRIRNRFVVLAAACLGTSFLAAAGGQEVFRYDFRQKTPPPGSFQLVGKAPKQHIRPQSAGLKITLPAGDGEKALPQAGVKFNRIIIGDFKITLEYEVNKVDRPTAGYGSGASIFLQTDSLQKRAATLAALLPKSGEMRFVTTLHTTNDIGKRVHNSKGFPVGDEARKGTLQLVRTGKELRCLATPAGEPAPKELRVLELGDEPVTLLRLVADPGGSPTGVEVTLKDLEVHADKLTTASERLAQSASSAKWIAVLGVVAALALGGTFTQRERLRRLVR